MLAVGSVSTYTCMQIYILTADRARQGSSPLVTLDLPKALSEQVMNALKADPRTVDLRALAPHFYRLGCRILQLFEEEEMADVLSHVRLPFGALYCKLLCTDYFLLTTDRRSRRGRCRYPTMPITLPAQCLDRSSSVAWTRRNVSVESSLSITSSILAGY